MAIDETVWKKDYQDKLGVKSGLATLPHLAPARLARVQGKP